MADDHKKSHDNQCDNENVSVDIKKIDDNIKVDIDAGEDVEVEVEKHRDNIEIKIVTDDEIIDIEVHSKECKPVPAGKRYRIKVDREYHVVDKECMLGSEILLLAGKKPSENQLRQKLNSGAVVTIANDQKVCFTDPGIEKFKTLPLDQTEGQINSQDEIPRRDFVLLDEDQDYLNSLDLVWEAINWQGAQWVLVRNFPIPTGFNVSRAILAVRMSPGYPTAQLDMIYFYPHISRLDGQPMNALTDFPLDNKMFQQWSRHRTAQNAWRPDIDNLSTHIPLAEAWLLQEFQKRPYHAKSA